MLLDKLTLINNALIATGNEPVTTDDGSAQWIAASTAYDRMLVEISEARSKADSEMPRRVAFRSGFLEKRRRRMLGWWL